MVPGIITNYQCIYSLEISLSFGLYVIYCMCSRYAKHFFNSKLHIHLRVFVCLCWINGWQCELCDARENRSVVKPHVLIVVAPPLAYKLCVSGFELMI